MLVDYVRVYQQVALASGTPNISPNGIVDAALGGVNLAAGGLATVYGSNLAEGTYPSTFNAQTGSFATSTPFEEPRTTWPRTGSSRTWSRARAARPLRGWSLR